MAECPAFPELSCSGDSVRPVLARLDRGIRKLAERLPRRDLIHRQSIGPVTLSSLTVSFTATVRSPAWVSPVDATFSIVEWPHQSEGWVIWIPILTIFVLGRTQAEAQQLATAEIRAAVARDSAMWSQRLEGVSLPRLAEIQRARRIKLFPMKILVRIRTPKLAVQIEEQDRQPRESAIKDATDSLITESIPPAIGNEVTVSQVASILTARRPRSVLMVGPSGVGKTAAFRELVRRRAEFGLEPTDFRATSGARLVAGMSGFGMWQERCQALCRECEKSSLILHLGSLAELIEVGRCEGNSMGIATFLRPYLVRGVMLAVAECTPEQLALIERQHPQVVQAFDIVRLSEPDSTVSRAILAHCAQEFPRPFVPRQAVDAYPHDPAQRSTGEVEVELIDDAGLAAIERLHRRYATYSAFPGRPLRFLKNLLRDRLDTIQLRASLGHGDTRSALGEAAKFDQAVRGDASGQPQGHPAIVAKGWGPLTQGDIIAAFSRETGLPPFLLDDSIAFDPKLAEQHLLRRVVGQQVAVDHVTNLLATIKAGLTRPGRPLASLLFIGPTGVGKTELARTLAEYLFGDEDRLTRLDMSEYGDPVSAQRLIGGTIGDEGVLTARIREQPFSVVLLDEFEKADGMVFDLMLQVLGEGRLTDGSGRLADFTNAVIVMTSNLGAESYQQGAAGFARPREDISDHFIKAVRNFFRPELFNRFDAIIPFQALTLDVLRSIAQMQVGRIRSRDGLLFRERSWELDPPVIDELVKVGYDPRYGARPLRRAIERELLAPLAEQINNIAPERTVTVTMTATQQGLAVRVSQFQDQSGRAVDWSQSDEGVASSVSRIADIRRRTRQMLDGPQVQAIRNEFYRLNSDLERERRRMLKRTAMGKPWKPEPDYNRRLARAALLQALTDQLQILGTSIDSLEDKALIGLLTENRGQSIESRELAALDAEWWRLASEIYLQQFPTPDKLTLAIFSESASSLMDLVMAYREIATQSGVESFELYEYSASAVTAESKPIKFENANVVMMYQRQIRNWPAYLNEVDDSVIGMAWQMAGRGIYARLHKEAGLHSFTTGNQETQCLVRCEPVGALDFAPHPFVARQGAIAKIGKSQRRRDYDQTQSVIYDYILESRWPWRSGLFEKPLAELIRMVYETDVKKAVLGDEVTRVDKDLNRSVPQKK